jgi:hypothetical protein
VLAAVPVLALVLTLALALVPTPLAPLVPQHLL